MNVERMEREGRLVVLPPMDWHGRLAFFSLQPSDHDDGRLHLFFTLLDARGETLGSTSWRPIDCTLYEPGFLQMRSVWSWRIRRNGAQLGGGSLEVMAGSRWALAVSFQGETVRLFIDDFYIQRRINELFARCAAQAGKPSGPLVGAPR